MERTVKIGPRFLIPSQSQLSTKFIEMRRVGSYPEDISLAFLYAYIEHSLENSRDLHQLSHGLDMLQDLIPEASDLVSLLEGKASLWPDTSFLAQTDILQKIEELSQLLQTKLSLSFNNDYTTIVAIDTLCKRFHSSCQLFYIAADFQMIGEMPVGQEVTKSVFFLCFGLQNFILYNRLTVDSFANLSCGCVALNYFLYRSAAKHIRGAGISPSNISECKLQCRSCPQTVSADDLNLIFLHTPPSSTQIFHMQTKTEECSHKIERGIVCVECGLMICADCAIIRTLTVYGATCPGCSCNFLDLLLVSTLVQKYDWADPIIKIVIESQTEVPSQLSSSIPGKRTYLQSHNGTENLSKSQIALPTDLHHKAAAEEEKTVLSVFRYQSKRCPKCGNEIEHSLCSKGCICVSCELQRYYSILNSEAKCSVCGEKLGKFFDANEKCLICKKDFERKKLAYFCAGCKLQVCNRCSKLNPEVLLICPTTSKPHTISEEKMKATAKYDGKECNPF